MVPYASSIRQPVPALRSVPTSEPIRAWIERTDDLRHYDFSNCDLSGLNLAGKDLRQAILFRANLTEAFLEGAILDDAELAGATLVDANLTGATLRRTSLGEVDLTGATLFNAICTDASFSGASAVGVDFRCSDCSGARFRKADIRSADFTKADLRDADMAFTSVEKAVFRRADLRGACLEQLVTYEKADWIGVDLRNINFTGAYNLQRFIADQNYIEEFRYRNSLNGMLYWLWWVTSDCGRSMLRWCAWITIIVLFYASLYSVEDINFGSHDTWLTPLYFSVVTLTSLGYGDITPVSTVAQLTSMMEVLTGYVMLGGLLSILNNKFARRAA